MKRHGKKQVVAKLRQADELSAEGLTQAEFCKALGISVMTYHRWRKLALTKSIATARPQQAQAPERKSSTEEDRLNKQLSDERQSDNDYLVDENRRLKQIITDLLLEKTRLEELLNISSTRPRRSS